MNFRAAQIIILHILLTSSAFKPNGPLSSHMYSYKTPGRRLKN